MEVAGTDTLQALRKVHEEARLRSEIRQFQAAMDPHPGPSRWTAARNWLFSGGAALAIVGLAATELQDRRDADLRWEQSTCDNATRIVTDDTLNPAIPVERQRALVAQQLNILRKCPSFAS